MRSPTMTRAARARFVIAAAVLLVGVAACDSVGNMFSPGGPASEAPARLSLQASIPRFQQSAFATLELRVTAQYERVNETVVSLGTQRITLTNAATQQVPVSIELGVCLADAERLNATAEPAGCIVSLALTLLGDGRPLDSFSLNDLRLVPGVAAEVQQPVQLFEIASVSLTLGSGAALPSTPLSLVAGNSLALGATVLDGSGTAVAGRPITWSSTNSAAATVSEAGVITAVAAGTTQITAAVGGRSATTTITVTPPPQRLEIVAVPGNGVGRILSSPAGIDCTLGSGVATGSCAANFASGLTVVLSAVGQSPTTALFNGWTGACLSNGATPGCSLVLDAPRTAGASFVALAVLELTPGGSLPGIAVSSSTPSNGGLLFNCDLLGFTGNCALPFLGGTSVTLTATETLIARATSWTGCDSASRTSCVVALGTAPRAVQLQGTLGNVLRANLVNPTGLGSVTASNTGSSVLRAPLNCGTAVPSGQAVCSSGYPAGSSITVTAVAGGDSRFLGWSDPDCTAVSGLDCIINNTSGDGTDIVLDFGFEPNPFRLTLNLTGAGGGAVVDQQGNPLCTLGATETSRRCELTFPSATVLSLGGQPAGSGQFVGFGGDCAAATSCLITVDQPRTVTAEFTNAPSAATVRIVPAPGNIGYGFFVSENQDLACDVRLGSIAGSCTTTRLVGSTMTLTAFDDERVLTSSNHVFNQWAPGTPCAGSADPVCSFTVGPTGADFSASFLPASEIALELGGSGSEAGTLSATMLGFRTLPLCVYTSGIDPANCNFLVPTGRSLSITVTPAPGATVDTSSAFFCSWTGNASCTFTVTGDVSGFLFIFLSEEDNLFASAQLPMFDTWRAARVSRAGLALE